MAHRPPSCGNSSSERASAAAAALLCATIPALPAAAVARSMPHNCVPWPPGHFSRRCNHVSPSQPLSRPLAL
eukprot:5161728-Prymnesium_polylepis.1